MTLEELNIVISADISDFTKEVKTVKKSVDDLMKNTTKDFNNIKKTVVKNFGGATKEINKTTEAVQKSVKQIKKATNSIGKSIPNDLLGGISKGFTSLFGKLKMFLLTLGIGSIIKNSFTDGIEAIESENLFEVSLGGYANEVRNWTNEVSEALGVNEYYLRKNIGTFYVFNKNLGISAEESKKMSKNLGMLVEDMASFYNMSSEDAMIKLASGIAGEIEPLRKLGIDVSEAAVKQWYLARGLETVNGELTQQERVLARYNIIMEQTTKAQGDLGRTLGSPANQIRILQAELYRLKVAFTQAFLPVLQFILPVINKLVGAITKVITFIAMVTNALAGNSLNDIKQNTKDWYDYGDGIGYASDGVSDLEDNLDNAGKSAKKLKGYLMGFDEINNISKNDTSSSGSGKSDTNIGGDILDIPDIGGVNAFSNSLIEISDKARLVAEKIKAVFKSIKGFVAPILDFIKNNYKTIISILSGIGSAIAVVFAVGKWEVIKAAITGVISSIGAVLGTISAPILLVASYIGLIVALVVDLWQKSEVFRKTILDMLGGMFDTGKKVFDVYKKWFALLFKVFEDISPIFSTIFNMMKTSIESITKVVGALYTNILKPIGDFLVELWGMVIDTASEIYDAWRPTIEEWISAFTEFWQGTGKPFVDWLVNVLIQAFKDAKPILEKVLKIFKNMFKFMLNLNKKLATGDWNNIWIEMGKIVGSISSLIIKTLDDLADTIVETLINKVIECKNSVISNFKSIKENISTTLREAKNKVAEKFTEIKESIVGKGKEIKDMGLEPFAILKTKISETFNNIKTNANEKFEEIKNGIILKIGETKDKAATKFVEIKDALRQKAEDIRVAVVLKIKDLKDGAITKFKELKTRGAEVWNGIKTLLVDKAVSVKNSVVSKIGSMKEGFNAILSFIKNTFTEKWGSAWNGVKNAFGNVFKNLSNGIKPALNSVISLINRAIGKINQFLGFKIPAWVQGIGGTQIGVQIPQIPYLAQGGVVDRKTLAYVGEAGKEAVLPLENNTGWMNDLATKLNSIGGKDTPLTVEISLDGTKLGKAVISSINSLQKQNGKILLRV